MSYKKTNLVLLAITSWMLFPVQSESFELSSAQPLLIADGGEVTDEISSFEPYKYKKFTLLMQGGEKIHEMLGEIQHPYITDSFEIQINSAIVKESTVSANATSIRFQIELQESIGSEKVELFTTRPPERASYRGNYPHQVAWITFEARDGAGKVIEAHLFTDPVLLHTDYAMNYPFETRGFPQEVVSVAISAFPNRLTWTT